jgi:hypothetical protein
MIYVGRDQAMPVHWSVYVNGEWEQIDDARTLKQAKERGHLQFDRGNACSLRLDWRSDWHLVDGTRSSSANAWPRRYKGIAKALAWRRIIVDRK